jgi:hypothetical protein
MTNGFASDGFILGDNVSGTGSTNQNAYTYVAWNWKANGAGVSNTAGTISSTVSANTTAGFSIVTYTGTGANATVGHGLGVAPSMVIIKDRTNGTKNWTCYHASLGNDRSIFLNLTDAQTASTDHWQYTTPTSSVVYIGDYSHINTSSDNYVMYAFAPIAGYSAFGKYSGNGSSDGPFIFTGFRPRWIMIKRITNADNWNISDTVRDTYNIVGNELYANLSNAESTSQARYDILSNGFKIRTAGSSFNGSSNDYVYAAFAENPFKFSLGR